MRKFGILEIGLLFLALVGLVVVITQIGFSLWFWIFFIVWIVLFALYLFTATASPIVISSTTNLILRYHLFRTLVMIHGSRKLLLPPMNVLIQMSSLTALPTVTSATMSRPLPMLKNSSKPKTTVSRLLICRVIDFSLALSK